MSESSRTLKARFLISLIKDCPASAPIYFGDYLNIIALLETGYDLTTLIASREPLAPYKLRADIMNEYFDDHHDLLHAQSPISEELALAILDDIDQKYAAKVLADPSLNPAPKAHIPFVQVVDLFITPPKKAKHAVLTGLLSGVLYWKNVSDFEGEGVLSALELGCQFLIDGQAAGFALGHVFKKEKHRKRPSASDFFECCDCVDGELGRTAEMILTGEGAFYDKIVFKEGKHLHLSCFVFEYNVAQTIQLNAIADLILKAQEMIKDIATVTIVFEANNDKGLEGPDSLKLLLSLSKTIQLRMPSEITVYPIKGNTLVSDPLEEEDPRENISPLFQISPSQDQCIGVLLRDAALNALQTLVTQKPKKLIRSTGLPAKRLSDFEIEFFSLDIYATCWTMMAVPNDFDCELGDLAEAIGGMFNAERPKFEFDPTNAPYHADLSKKSNLLRSFILQTIQSNQNHCHTSLVWIPDDSEVVTKQDSAHLVTATCLGFVEYIIRLYRQHDAVTYIKESSVQAMAPQLDAIPLASGTEQWRILWDNLMPFIFEKTDELLSSKETHKLPFRLMVELSIRRAFYHAATEKLIPSVGLAEKPANFLLLYPEKTHGAKLNQGIG